MDQEERKVLPGRFDPGTSENSSSSVNGVVIETVISVNSEERDSMCISEENGGLKVLDCELGSSKQINEHEQGVNQEVIDRCGGSKVPSQVDRGKSEDSKEVNKRVSESEKNSCVIDVKCSSGIGFGENWDGERVCRICHLSSEQSTHMTVMVTSDANMTTTTDLIQLGCGCKDELGIAHTYCAEAWFKLRGNRLCEICGKTAKNITGVADNRFMEEWNERRFTGGSSNSSDRGGGCWRGQPFCNFLMACLVIAFVLPWFFRVNMF